MLIDKLKENPFRLHVCEECECSFADEELRRDYAKGEWGHKCKDRKYKKEVRCESFLQPYLPENLEGTHHAQGR